MAERIDAPTLAHSFRRELFEVVLPFWERHGIDHEYGGFFCALDYDGRQLSSRKFHWFQGRGLWLWSFLYNHYGRDPRHLEIARRAKEFMLARFPQSDGWWAETVTRAGRTVQPFRGDLYGMYFAAEGLQEYAEAAGDEQALETALGLLRRLWERINRPEIGVRPQGLWMMNLRIATQMLARRNLPEVACMGEAALDAIVNRHYNPDIGLNVEDLNFDFTPTASGATLCAVGHSVECLWMAMHEAMRRGDRRLWEECAARLRRHLDVGWDHVYGGLVTAVNVGQTCYEWPLDRPVGTALEFRERGEYNYTKSFWSVNEVQIAALHVWEHAREDWAARYFNLAQEVADGKFSLRTRGFPLYLLFSDRQIGFQPRTGRQDNYHHPRSLALNILALERIAAGAAERGSASG